MFGSKKQDGPIEVRVSGPPATAAEIGEHEALAALHLARQMKRRATDALTTAERLTTDADAALSAARREVRRTSER